MAWLSMSGQMSRLETPDLPLGFTGSTYIMIVHVLHILWLYYIYIYTIMCMWVCVWVLYTHNHTHAHIYIYICIWVCAVLSCDRIMMSYPLPVYFEKSSMDCLHPPNCLRHGGKRLQNPPVMNRTPSGRKVVLKWWQIMSPSPASNIRDIPIFGDLKLKSSRKKSGFRLGERDCNVDCWPKMRRNRMWHVKWCDTILVRYIFNIPINLICD